MIWTYISQKDEDYCDSPAIQEFMSGKSTSRECYEKLFKNPCLVVILNYKTDETITVLWWQQPIKREMIKEVI